MNEEAEKPPTGQADVDADADVAAEADAEKVPRSSSPASGQRLLKLALCHSWDALEKLLKVLEKGDPEIAQVDQESGLNVLMVAVKENQYSVVAKLMDLGLNPNEQTMDGQTALHLAAAHSKEDIVKLLLKKADPDVLGGEGELLTNCF